MNFPDLLRDSWRVFVREWRVIILTAGLTYLFACAILVLVSRLMVSLLPPVDVRSVWDSLGGASKFGIVLFSLVTIWVPLGSVQAGVACIVSDVQAGQRPTERSVVVAILRFLPLGAPLYTVAGALSMFASLFCVFPSLIVAALASFIAPAIVLERAGLRAVVTSLRVATRNFRLVLASWFLYLFGCLVVGLAFAPLLFAILTISGAPSVLPALAFAALFTFVGEIGALHGCLLALIYLHDRVQRAAVTSDR